MREKHEKPFFSERRLKRLKNLFAVDVRSLAAVRVGMGLLLLITLSIRAFDVTAHYSDAGVLPRAARIALEDEWVGNTPPYWVSLHMLSGAAWFQLGLFAAAGVAAVGVVIGYRTRLALAVSWLLLVSLQGRNPLVLHGGDDVLRCLLFWSLFLPMGAVWSVDRWLTRSQSPARVRSFASAAVLLQLCIIYWFTALLKTDPLWRSDFTAVYYALQMDHFTTRFGYWLLQFPTLLQFLTAGVLALEFAGPTLLFAPKCNRVFRIAVPAAFILFHAGLAATMELGEFPYICMIYWMIILPPAFWRSRFVKKLEAICTTLVSAGAQRATRLAKPFRWRRLFGNPENGFFRIGIASNVLMILLLGYVLLVNCCRLNGNRGWHLAPGPLRILGDAAQLNQYWGMFAPRPYATGGWLSLQGRLLDGRTVNLFQTDAAPLSEEPPLISATYPNMQWRRYLLNLVAAYCPTQRHGLSDYLRRRWNSSHGPDQQVSVVEFIHMAKPIAEPDACEQEPVVPIVLLRKDYAADTFVMARDSGIGGI